MGQGKHSPGVLGMLHCRAHIPQRSPRSPCPLHPLLFQQQGIHTASLALVVLTQSRSVRLGTLLGPQPGARRILFHRPQAVPTENNEPSWAPVPELLPQRTETSAPSPALRSQLKEHLDLQCRQCHYSTELGRKRSIKRLLLV